MIGTKLIFDHAENQLVVKREQDVQPILEMNKKLYTEGDGYSPSRTLRRVASIPFVVIERWINDEGINIFKKDHWNAVKKKLNDPDYLFLRTSRGRI